MFKKDSAKISKIFGEQPEQAGQTEQAETEKEDWMTENEGQLALDAYQDEDSVIIKAPIAGVKPEDIEVAITDDLVTIKGERKQEAQITSENYFAQECYWGSFSRQVSLPPGCDTEKANASLKNGVLTLKIPKEPKSKTKLVKISTEED